MKAVKEVFLSSFFILAFAVFLLGTALVPRILLVLGNDSIFAAHHMVRHFNHILQRFYIQGVWCFLSTATVFQAHSWNRMSIFVRLALNYEERERKREREREKKKERKRERERDYVDLLQRLPPPFLALVWITYQRVGVCSRTTLLKDT